MSIILKFHLSLTISQCFTSLGAKGKVGTNNESGDWYVGLFSRALICEDGELLDEYEASSGCGDSELEARAPPPDQDMSMQEGHILKSPNNIKFEFILVVEPRLTKMRVGNFGACCMQGCFKE
jgi:hypothetical protein